MSSALRVILLATVGFVFPGVVSALQVDPDELSSICTDDEVECLKADHWDNSGCFLVYTKQSEWFGLLNRWYVYSMRGGPTILIRDLKKLIYIDRRAAMRAAASTVELLDEIGAGELRSCDVNFFLQCVDSQLVDWTMCQERLTQRLAFWKSRISSAQD